MVTQAPPPLNLKLKLPDSSARCQGMVSNTTQCQRGLNCTQHREVNERFYRQGQRKASQAPGMFRSQNAWYRAASVWWSELDAEENGEHAGETPNSKGKKKMHNIISVGTPKRQQQPFLEEQAAADALLGLVRKSPNGQMAASRLCRKLYKQCASARSLIARHGGLKNCIASPMLANVVQWVDNGVPDQGCGYVTLKEQGGAAGLASYRDDSRQECFGGSSSRPLHKQRPLSHEPAGPEKATPAKQPEATVAIFVDAENLGHYLKRHSGAQRLVQEAKQYGSPIVRKAFGDWSQPGVNAHQALLVENGMCTVCAYTCVCVCARASVHSQTHARARAHTQDFNSYTRHIRFRARPPPTLLWSLTSCPHSTACQCSLASCSQLATATSAMSSATSKRRGAQWWGWDREVCCRE